jgi:hypothetical protein
VPKEACWQVRRIKMKCPFCGKHIDEVDCKCKMCTLCGWSSDATIFASKDTNEKKAE